MLPMGADPCRGTINRHFECVFSSLQAIFTSDHTRRSNQSVSSALGPVDSSFNYT